MCDTIQLQTKTMDPMLRPGVNFGKFLDFTLNLIEAIHASKDKINLEFWQWVWKGEYIHLGYQTILISNLTH